ncbi:hypothetical protein BC936DRAFT_139840 [Jimgerdemannia flammicorona]|uniref:Uncharacterized protein n=1 Tax=Jimgerdemannia flammicorona TaxID=994334 RepID=A0A433B965_9FUNG|nr:hypothetical protein BC936DRAFT_139840 [Jimgerdemannia flammicorona]
MTVQSSPAPTKDEKMKDLQLDPLDFVAIEHQVYDLAASDNPIAAPVKVALGVIEEALRRYGLIRQPVPNCFRPQHHRALPLVQWGQGLHRSSPPFRRRPPPAPILPLRFQSHYAAHPHRLCHLSESLPRRRNVRGFVCAAIWVRFRSDPRTHEGRVAAVFEYGEGNQGDIGRDEEE